jgi:uncharacterized phage infection (PIP) family protein YhgE
MTTPVNNNSPTLESLADGQQHLIEAVTTLSEAVQALANGQQHLAGGVQALADGENHLSASVRALADAQNAFGAFVAEQRDFNGRVESFMAQVGTFMSDANGQFASINANLTATNEKLDGLKDDIGLVKGGHARNELRHRASLIANDLGYQLISELPQGALIAFAQIAVANGVAPNEVESFRNADMVMMVQDSNNQPGYVAVEVSYTVNSNDVRRAVRNADYLQQYTGIRSHAVVAGVDILPEAKQRADTDNVYWYKILAREIQPA